MLWLLRPAVARAPLVVVLAEAALISQVNPQFLREAIPAEQIHSRAVVWGVGNDVAALAVGAALVLLTSWRAGLLDTAETEPPAVTAATASLRCLAQQSSCGKVVCVHK